jgi:hypothetical protein
MSAYNEFFQGLIRDGRSPYSAAFRTRQLYYGDLLKKSKSKHLIPKKGVLT